MATSNEDSITLTANCLCKANVFKTQVPKSKLPLEAYTCHCDSCRHVTGNLVTSDARWPQPRAEVDISKLKVYHFFPTVDLLFCPTCSTPMFFSDPRNTDRLLGAFTGTLSHEHAGLIKFVNQGFVEDTKDGGASVWMRHPNQDGSEQKRYMLHSDSKEATEVPQDWPTTSNLTGYEAKGEDAIPIRCKCKGVDFVLHQGDYSGIDEKDMPWNVDPKTHKLLGDFCGCDSCRLQSGLDMVYWTFSDLKYISFSKSEKMFLGTKDELQKLVDAHDESIGTLTYYESSPDVQRYFCSTCSATVFYSVDSRPELVDIAIGLLDASDGARAEGFLSWNFGDNWDHEGDAKGGWREDLYHRVRNEAEDYRIARGYPKSWYRLKKEKKANKQETK